MRFSFAVIALLATSAQAIRIVEEPKDADKKAEATKVEASHQIPFARVGEQAVPTVRAKIPGNDQAEPAISDQVGGAIESKEGNNVSIHNPNLVAPSAPAGSAKAAEEEKEAKVVKREATGSTIKEEAGKD